jgi:hypothetical protein
MNIPPAYIACFTDCDGTITANIRRKPARLQIKLYQRDPEILIAIRDTLGYGNLHHRMMWDRKQYTLAISAREHQLKFLRLIYPHLIMKRQQAKLAYQMLMSPKEERVTFARQIQRLNQGYC